MRDFLRRDGFWLLTVAALLLGWRLHSVRQTKSAAEREDTLAGHVIALEIESAGYKAKADNLDAELRKLREKIATP